GPEPLVRRLRLRVQGDDLDAQVRERGEVVAVVAELLGTDGRVVAGIEDQQDGSAAEQLRERDLALGGGEREVPSAFADVGMGCHGAILVEPRTLRRCEVAASDSARGGDRSGASDRRGRSSLSGGRGAAGGGGRA